MAEETAPSSQPLFRPSKRRKIVRPARDTATSEDDNTHYEGHRTIASSDPKANDGNGSDAELTLVYKVRKPRARVGLDVTKTANLQPQASMALAVKNEEPTSRASILGKSFAPQTGLVKDDLDKHM